MWSKYVPWEYVGPALAAAVGYFLKHFLSERAWSAVKKVALGILQDETKTNDAEEAVVQAVVIKNKERIKRYTAEIVNGHDKSGRIKITREGS